MIPIYSPEDIVLQKLSWYKLIPGGSQKQWRDVLGVLKVQGERLDRAYLHQWALTLKLTDLLSGALLESGHLNIGINLLHKCSISKNSQLRSMLPG